jgi:hypothetical protein
MPATVQAQMAKPTNGCTYLSIHRICANMPPVPGCASCAQPRKWHMQPCLCHSRAHLSWQNPTHPFQHHTPCQTCPSSLHMVTTAQSLLFLQHATPLPSQGCSCSFCCCRKWAQQWGPVHVDPRPRLVGPACGWSTAPPGAGSPGCHASAGQGPGRTVLHTGQYAALAPS